MFRPASSVLAPVCRATIALTALTLAAPTPGLAETLLGHSQHSYASACLSYSGTHRQIAQTCELALAEPGASPGQRAEMLISLGDALLNLGDHDRADSSYRAALDLKPGAAGAHSGLGWTAYDLDDHVQAVEHFQAALALNVSAGATAGLAASRHALAHIPLEEAIRQYDLAHALDPSYAWAIRQKGWAYFDADRFPETEQAFHAALEVDGRSINALYGLARSLRFQDKLKLALVPLTEAIGAAPDTTLLYSERAYVFWLLDWNKMAVRDAERVIAEWPDRPSGYVTKARALADLGRRAEGVALLRQASTRLGYDAYLAYHLSVLLSHEGDNAGAAEALGRIVAAGDADPWDFVLLAEIELARGAVDDAAIAVAAALERQPDMPDALLLLAIVAAERADFDSAIGQFDAALAQGLDWDRYAELAQVLARKGAGDRAIALGRRYDAWKRAQP